MRAGKVKYSQINDMNVCIESIFKRIKDSFRPGVVLVVVLLVSATMIAIMPGSANLIAEPALSAAIDQPSGCPCSGGCGTQPATQDAQAQNTEANATIQQVQPAYSPVSALQPVESAPAANVPAAVADKPASVVPESANNDRNADLTGSFSPAGLKQFMPSWWLNNQQSGDKLYNIFEKKLDVQPVSLGSVFADWHKGPVSMVSSFL